MRECITLGGDEPAPNRADVLIQPVSWSMGIVGGYQFTRRRLVSSRRLGFMLCVCVACAPARPLRDEHIIFHSDSYAKQWRSFVPHQQVLPRPLAGRSHKIVLQICCAAYFGMWQRRTGISVGVANSIGHTRMVLMNGATS